MEAKNLSESTEVEAGRQQKGSHPGSGSYVSIRMISLLEVGLLVCHVLSCHLSMWHISCLVKSLLVSHCYCFLSLFSAYIEE